MSESKTGVRVQDTHLKLAQIMTPTDANVLGKVFGGSILSMIDLTASATAQKFAGRVCVTASFERVDFHTPIDVGALVTMRGHVSYAGRTSVEVTIDVTATDLPTGRDTHTNTARVIMVAVENGRPVPVPTLICETRLCQWAPTPRTPRRTHRPVRWPRRPNPGHGRSHPHRTADLRRPPAGPPASLTPCR